MKGDAMTTDDRDQPVARPRVRTWMEMLADRLDPPDKPQAGGPATPNSKAMTDERED
jgi:hypothetical protein